MADCDSLRRSRLLALVRRASSFPGAVPGPMSLTHAPALRLPACSRGELDLQPARPHLQGCKEPHGRLFKCAREILGMEDPVHGGGDQTRAASRACAPTNIVDGFGPPVAFGLREMDGGLGPRPPGIHRRGPPPGHGPSYFAHPQREDEGFRLCSIQTGSGPHTDTAPTAAKAPPGLYMICTMSQARR
jgi:hypothetical protein